MVTLSLPNCDVSDAARTGRCSQVQKFTQGCVITPETELYDYEWGYWRLCLPCYSHGLFKVHSRGSDLSAYMHQAVKWHLTSGTVLVKRKMTGFQCKQRFWIFQVISAYAFPVFLPDFCVHVYVGIDTEFINYTWKTSQPWHRSDSVIQALRKIKLGDEIVDQSVYI